MNGLVKKKSGPLKILWMNGLMDEWMNWSFASDSLMIKNLNKVIFVGLMDEWINEKKKSGPLKFTGWMD